MYVENPCEGILALLHHSSMGKRNLIKSVLAIPLLFLFLVNGISQKQIISGESPKSGMEDSWLSWEFRTEAPITASPAISEGVVYIGSMDSTFYAIDAETGALRWKYKTDDGISSSAILYRDLCYFESGNTLYALNRKGVLQWKTALCTGQVNSVLDPWDFHHSSPIIHDGVAYIGTEQGFLLGIDAQSGIRKLVIQTETENAIRATPVVFEGLVMYGDWEGVFYANRIEDGALVWQYDTKKDGTFPWKNAIHGSPLVENGQVYFAGRSCRLYSLDAHSGNKNWHYSSPTDQWLLGGPELIDGTVYLGSSDQYLFHAIDAKSGELIWTTETDGRTWGKPCVKEAQVYIGGNSFFVLDRVSGEVQKEFEFPQVHEEEKFGEYINRNANFHSSPLIYGGMAILGSDDGHLYAIKLAD